MFPNDLKTRTQGGGCLEEASDEYLGFFILLFPLWYTFGILQTKKPSKIVFNQSIPPGQPWEVRYTLDGDPGSP